MALRTPKWIALALGLSLTIALLALAACGGSSSTTSTATATSAGQSTATNAGGSTATNTGQATATSGSSDIASQLAALGGKIQQSTGKITYTDTSTDGTTTSLTYYSGPPNFRYDSTGSDGSLSIYIETPQTTYICTSADQTCIASAGSGTGSAGLGLLSGFFSPALIDAMSAAAQAQGVSITKSNETIAGTNATCYSGVSSGSTDKFCFSDSGILLSTQTTDASGGTSGLTATAYSSDVSASDFQPPYPVTTIPAIPTG
jgi:TolA-binding protein